MEQIFGGLKHLGFVKMAASFLVFCVSHLYDYAKRNSGPLKSTVLIVEKSVTTVVGPVYEMFKGVPDNVLVVLDNKVDEASILFNKYAPPGAKKIVGKAQHIVLKASEIAVYLALETQIRGYHATILHALSLFKEFAVMQLAVLWYEVNRFPILNAVGHMTIQTAGYWSQKYNKFITKMDDRGYHIFGNCPLVPVDDVVKAYKQVEAARGGKEG